MSAEVSSDRALKALERRLGFILSEMKILIRGGMLPDFLFLKFTLVAVWTVSIGSYGSWSCET